MKLLLVDDHDLFATSLKVVLERFEDIEEVAILKTPDSLWPFLATEVFSLVMLDIHLGSVNGLDIGRQVKERYPKIPIVFLTGFDLAEYQYQANEIGANGFFNKSIAPRELYAALKKIVNAEPLEQEKQIPARPKHGYLSPKEIQTLVFVSQGLNRSEISEKLSVSKRTIETLMQHIYKKLGVQNASSAVVEGIKLGIIQILPEEE